MTDQEINIAIAKLFGFKFSEGPKSVLGHNTVQVSYPERFDELRCGIPELSIPDFVDLITEAIQDIKHYGGHVPRDYDPLPLTLITKEPQ